MAPRSIHSLSEKTLIPISLVVTIIGGVAFVTKTHSMALEAKEAALAAKKAVIDAEAYHLENHKRIYDQINSLRGEIHEVSERTSTIDGKLDVLIKRRD